MKGAACITLIDPIRQAEIDNFYQICQMHRDQYKDHSGRLDPLDYFKRTIYTSSCYPDPTSVYLKYPIYYIEYQQPIILPVTLERTVRFPTIESAFQPRFNKRSDTAYKR